MAHMIKLADKDIKAVIITILRMFKRVKENKHVNERSGSCFSKETQIELPEMKNKISEVENTADEINRHCRRKRLVKT